MSASRGIIYGGWFFQMVFFFPETKTTALKCRLIDNANRIIEWLGGPGERVGNYSPEPARAAP